MRDVHTQVLGDRVVIAVEEQLVCIDLPSRKEVWRKAADSTQSTSLPAPRREWLFDANVVAVQLTDQKLSLRDAQGEERWMGRFRPYIYDVARLTSGLVLVATAGQGGYVHVVDVDTGEIRSRTKVPGGAHDFVHASPTGGHDDGHVLASGWKSFARIDPAGNVTLWKVRHAFRAIWARGDEVAVLTNPPSPGIAFVRCR